MRDLYIWILLLLILIMIFSIAYISMRQEHYSKILTKLLGSAVVSSVFYILFLRSVRIQYATFWNALYFFMCDVLSYLMLLFIEEYTEVELKHPVFNKILLFFVGVDGVALMLNNKFHMMFVMKERFYGSEHIRYFMSEFKFPHYFHLAFCYLMVGYTFGLLLFKFFSITQFYKLKYIVIFVPFCMLIIINAICYSRGLPYDVSVGLYGVLALVICICAYAVVPNKIVTNAQNYVMENVSRGIVCFDETGKCIYKNKSMMEVLERSDEKFRQNFENFFLKKDGEFQVKNKNYVTWNDKFNIGDTLNYILFKYRALRDKKDRYMGCFFVVENKTEEVEKNIEQRYRADYDLLTGLYNKVRFFSEAKKIIDDEPDAKKWMIVSDIKDFKLINNIYGNKYGDEILKLQANLIKEHMREGIICGRISGDKFAMLVKDDKYDIKIFENAVRKLQEYTMQKKYKIFYHIGVYDITGLTDEPEKLYNRVNMAIATIKDDYNKTFIKCDSSIAQKMLTEKNMITEFDDAVENDQFKMYLQPQVNAKGVTVGAEALVRWEHPEKGLIFPGDFIEVFEKANLIHKMDLYIWNKAAKKLAEWKKKGNDKVHISINISTKDFYYLDIYEELTNIVKENDIDAKLLKLEITESAALLDQNTGFSTISKLRDFGFEVEIDDFGSGYSSLNMLKDLNVDVLKIDRIFLNETENKEKSRMILKSIISLAKNMGMCVVAEGVEELYQIDNLINMGCDVFQGYYYDKPINVSQFEEKYLKRGEI